jgi:hypothetical protein
MSKVTKHVPVLGFSEDSGSARKTAKAIAHLNDGINGGDP